MKTPDYTYIVKRPDGIWVVVYKNRQVALCSKKRWARASLRRAIRSNGASN